MSAVVQSNDTAQAHVPRSTYSKVSSECHMASGPYTVMNQFKHISH